MSNLKSNEYHAVSANIILFPEANNSDTNANEETPGEGLFIQPSPNVPGRPSDITGYYLTASNSDGKVEWTDITIEPSGVAGSVQYNSNPAGSLTGTQYFVWDTFTTNAKRLLLSTDGSTLTATPFGPGVLTLDIRSDATATDAALINLYGGTSGGGGILFSNSSGLGAIGSIEYQFVTDVLLLTSNGDIRLLADDAVTINSSAGGSAGDITIQPNDVTGVNGANTYIYSGSSTSNDGGDIFIRAGQGDTTSFTSSGGDVFMSAASTSNGNGGNVSIASGISSTGSGGYINFSGGQTGTATGFNLFFEGSSVFTGGNISMSAGGDLGTGGATGGSISLTAGPTGTTTGGDLNLSAGAANTSGTGGDVQINSGTSATGTAGNIVLEVGVSGGTNGELQFIVGGVTYIWPSAIGAIGQNLQITGIAGSVVTLGWV